MFSQLLIPTNLLDIKLTPLIFILFFIASLFWVKFCFHMLIQLSKRVGLIMTDSEMPSPIATEQNDSISLLKPHTCPQCHLSQKIFSFVPFKKFAAYHTSDCPLKDEPQKDIFKTELIFACISFILLGYLFFTHHQPVFPVLTLYALLIPLSLFDMEFHWVPDRFSMVFLFLGLLTSHIISPESRIIGGAVYASVIAFVFLITSFIKQADMSSAGDVILMAGAGAWIGTDHLFLFTIFLFVFSLITALYQVKLHKNLTKNATSLAFPLAPSILAATLISFIIISS